MHPTTLAKKKPSVYTEGFGKQTPESIWGSELRRGTRTGGFDERAVFLIEGLPVRGAPFCLGELSFGKGDKRHSGGSDFAIVGEFLWTFVA
jgi:hypothetical protein